MRIDAKGIQLLVWRIIRFSGSCCFKFVRKYPVVSEILIFVFFLYIFSPSVFHFLMYSSPVLVCTVVSIRCYLKAKYPESQWIKEKESDERSSADVKFVNTSDGPSLRPQKSVRRNARKEVLEWDGKYSEERDMLFLRSPCDSLSSETSREHGVCSSYNETGNDRALDDPNLVFDNETSKPHRVSGDSFQGPSGKGPSDDGGGGGEVEVESLEEGDEDGNKAVEWTEYDQKNLVDLGLSELERNKRLESLMAKRRAKKLFKMAVGKSLMGMDSVPPSQIAQIIIAKNNILGVSSDPNEEELPMPGSAPSILLPTQNPFDLPYDPFEEKPNLMADSFQQEFMAANQKDMLFCRHESFRRGPSFTLATTQNPNDAKLNPYYSAEKRFFEGPTTARFKRQPDKGGHLQLNSSGIGSDIDLVELEESNHNEAINLSEGKKEKIMENANDRVEIGGKKEKPHDLEPVLDIGSEVRMEMDSIKNNDSCYSSSSEATEPVLDQTSKSPGIRNDHVRKALILAIPPKRKTVNRLPNDSSPSPSPSERRRADFNLFYNIYRRQCHTPTFSIASDLQVEVSEVGSPPLTADGIVPSVDGDSDTYDEDVDRDINSDTEELWGGSFNLSRAEANRERLKELDDIIEEGSVDIEFSGLKLKPEELIASISPFEQEAKQHLNSTSSLYSTIDITENGASNPTYINSETHEDVKKIDEVEGFKTFNVSDTLSPESLRKTMHVMEKSMVYSPSESCFEKPEKLIEPQQKPTEELNKVGDVKQITQGDANSLDLKSSENRENGAQLLIKPVALMQMIKPADANNLGSRDYRHGNLETSYEATSTMESEKELEESQPSKYTEEDTEILTKHNTGDAPNAVQSEDNLKSVPDGIIDQNIAEDNVSGVKESLGDSITMTLNRRLVLEQISVSSCSSPRSVLPQNILEDQIPISDVNQRTQRDLPRSVREDIVRDNLAEDQAHENLTFNTPQIAQQLVENSIDHSSSNCSLETLEESSNMTQNSTKYSTVHNMNEVMLEDTNGKEDPSIKSGEGESQALNGLKDAKELSKPSRESNPGSIHHLEGRSEKMIEYDTGIDPSKSEKENAKSGDPETTVREEEPTNSPRKVIEEGSIVVNINNSTVNEKEEGETLTTNEGESQFSIRLEDISRPEKSNEQEADVKKTEANERDYTSIVESAREREKSAVEVDCICDVNELLTDNVTNKEVMNHVLEGEGELRMLSRLEAVTEPSKTIGATSAGSVEDTELESKRLAEAEANSGLSTSAGEANSLNNIKNGEEIRSLTGQEGVLDAPQSGEDHLKAIESILEVGNILTSLSIEHNIAMEALKPKESEVKAVNTDENDSDAVAK